MKLKIFIFLLLSGSFSFADMMYVPTRSVSVDNAVTHFGKFQKGGGSNLHFMLRLGRDLDILNSFSMRGSKEDTLSKILKNLDAYKVQISFEKQLDQKRLWIGKTSKEHLTLIRDNRKKIDLLFGTTTYAAAWFQKKMGQIDISKKTLMALFETSYKKIEKLDNVVYGFGESPLFAITKVYNTLIWVSTEKEQAALKTRFRKLKVHISNLPQTHIHT
jgi:hypothetical protein